MKNIALTGGGTGGHIFPLVSLYHFLKHDKSLNFYWFGDENGLEYEISQEHGIHFEHIPSGKIRRYFDWRNFYEPLKNLSGIVWGIYFILKYKVDIVFSKGGFAGLPLCIAGFILRKPVYIHESDSVSGLSSRIISKIATKVFYTFPNALIDEENQKHILTGQILNPKLLKNIDKSGILSENEKLEVLVVAGSQGSTVLFENLKSILNNLIDVNFIIILGEKNLHFRPDFESYSNVTLHDFVNQEEMGKILEKTDIALTRGGATTLWELYYFGIHSIIVPLPTSAQGHQLKNALYFKEQFGSDILYESDKLNLEIFRLINKYKELRKASLNTKNFFMALQKIKKEILD